jgi:superfamily II DNA helicase RecQ
MHIGNAKAINAYMNRVASSSINDVDESIFESLRALRSEIAKATNMPAYIIFDNKTLQEIAYFLPDND